MKKISKKMQEVLDKLDDNDYIVCSEKANKPRMKIIICKKKCNKILRCKAIKEKIKENE